MPPVAHYSYLGSDTILMGPILLRIDLIVIRFVSMLLLNFQQFPTTPGPTCKHANYHQLTSPLKRWSSCSTIYIGDSCLAHLDQKSTLWGVSVGIGLLVRSEKNQRFSAPVRPVKSCHFSKSSAQDHDFSSEIYEDVYKIFDERVYSLEVSLKANQLSFSK